MLCVLCGLTLQQQGPSCCLHSPCGSSLMTGASAVSSTLIILPGQKTPSPEHAVVSSGLHGPGAHRIQCQPCLLSQITCQNQRGPQRSSKPSVLPGQDGPAVCLPAMIRSISEHSKPLSSTTLPRKALILQPLPPVTVFPKGWHLA